MGIFQAIAAGIGIGGGGALSYAGSKKSRKAMEAQIANLQSGLRNIGKQVGAAYGTLGRETAGFYQPLLDYQQQSSDQILNRFIAERQANTDQYRQGYEQNISQFQSAYDTIRQQYAAGMERVYGEAASGRQAMLESVDLATQQNVARQQAANAFSGLGLTTFGQGVVAARQAEGARQRGVIQEQYASQLAAIRQAQATGDTSLAQAQAGGLSDLRQRMTTGLAEMGTSYSSALAGMQQGFAGQRLGLMSSMQSNLMGYRQSELLSPFEYQEAALTIPFNAQMNIAQNRGAFHSQMGNALMGAGMGMLGGGFGGMGGMGGMGGGR
jgi:hypothetical protein